MKTKTLLSGLMVFCVAIGSVADTQASCITQSQAQAAINTKHAQNVALLGAPVGSLQAIGNVQDDGPFIGWRQRFQKANNASIIISKCDGTGAHIVQGFIGIKYDKLGDQDILGFPTSDEQALNTQYIVGRQSKFQNGTIVYKNGGTWEHGTFPILNRWWNSSNLSYQRISSDQEGGTITVTANNMAPNSNVQLWLNNWAGSVLIDTRKANGAGMVNFPARRIDNNDAGAGNVNGYIATLEVDDGNGHFAVVGAEL